jgi:hypothetical protein
METLQCLVVSLPAPHEAVIMELEKLAYVNQVIDILTVSPEMKKTVIGVTKQTSYTAGGSVIG